jgi:YggT family protein
MRWRPRIAARLNWPPSSAVHDLAGLIVEALRYVVDTLLWLLLLAFILRFLFQLVRADFRDPLADAIVRVTNWLILPLRRILPPMGKIDTATLVSVLLIAGVRTVSLLLLSRVISIDPLFALRLTVVSIIDLILRIYLFALLLYWLVSFIAPGGYASGVRLLSQLCEPILKPVRRHIPPIGQIDFSILWVSIAIGALLILIR